MARNKLSRYNGPKDETTSQGGEGAEGGGKKGAQERFANYEKASPTLLSQQPAEADPKADREREKATWSALRGHLEANLVMLRNWRQSWWTQNWADLAEFILPNRSIWLTQSTGGMPTPNNMTRGRPITQAIMDPTATLASRVCAAGLMSGLASPSRPWFKIMPARRGVAIDTAARAWLDETEERMYRVMATSNFYNSFAQECSDLTVFGTAPSIIYEDEADIIRCYNPAVGEYYLQSSATLRINGLYRLFVMTVQQMVDFFGLEYCSPDVQKLWAGKGAGLQMEKMIGHSIEPNYAIGKEGSGLLPGFTWREVYWQYGQGTAKPLSMRGFYGQPFTGGRWMTQSNDAYGRSPGMDILPDVMQLQVMTRRLNEAIEKQVRPPLLGSMELKNQPSSILPGHVTYVTNLGAGTGMRPIYEVNPDVGAMSMNIEKIGNRIKIGLFNDLFLMLETAPAGKMTAYEVAQKMQEKLQVLGPVIENLITESLKPKLQRIYKIMQNRGFIDEPPDSLKGQPLDIDFVSMLALAQRASTTGGMERLAALIGNMVGVYPEIKDVMDPDNFIREFSELLGNPQKILRGPEDVAEIRRAQAQRQQQHEQAAAMNQAADTAATGAQAAQTLSNTEVGAAGNALSMMLGIPGGGGGGGGGE